ncbi:hypothetical protein EDD18DRAFT_1191998 [Armillaria luteobubalina]|uniref:Nephrocystin 3-like N-terminal domain-containing protein n=1 Tax=Armillaria luteobubalina TaxID=153913 RepID=A0AA39ULM4_9AGAR|nr:hypothetical protein EDD18DRAFT_1191998 [Armillaria luteobubalina]
MAVVPNIEEPSESSTFLDPSTLQTVFEATKTMVDTLSGVHPAATIAWGFLSIGFEVLKNQCDKEDAIWNLYKDMISTYEEFSKDDILKEHDRFRGIYDCLFKQTIECAFFMKGYTNKSVIGRLVTMNISDQAEKFSHAFAGLKSQLSMELSKESVIVTLGVQKNVDIQAMRDRLRDLQPPKELRPKSKCMQGTRVATINHIVSWIAQCDGKVMWCNGLAGTGKSSLTGTLHDLLTTDFGGRSRLAAFIRYDRIEYRSATELITTIAYSLGMFDDRIGTAISRVIQSSRTVVTMSDPSAQFRLLLRNPLESIPDLVEGGPLVIIVDGLDECDISEELLAVLAEGFGPKLPFMRLIVTSRPVHHIAMALKGKSCVYPLYLDTSFKAVNDDIHFYLEHKLATIGDNVFQEKCTELDAVNELTERASGLFIWAATVVKFVHASPGISRLQALLDTEPPRDATEALTTLYRTSLDTLVSEPGANMDIKKYVRSVLGAVLVTRTPPGMTESVLDNIVLRGEGSPPSRHIVSMLGSVLSPQAKDSPIQIIHKSFDDFLQDQGRSGDAWFINVALHRQAIAEQSRIASKSFLETWSPTNNMVIGAVPAYISNYALFGRFWYSDFDKSDIELFTSFFRPHFLPWLDIVIVDGDILHFEIMDTICRQLGLTRLLLKVNIRDSKLIHHVLQISTVFYHHLHYASQESPLIGKVTLECMKAFNKSSFPEEPMDNSNLHINGVVSVHAFPTQSGTKDQYVYKITNTTSVPLYISMLCFDVSLLRVYSVYQPEGVNNPLPPGKLWTSYRNTFLINEGQDVDVSFLKLFFSTEYVDLSAIIHPAPTGRSFGLQVLPLTWEIPSRCHTMCVPLVQRRVAGTLYDTSSRGRA